MDQFFVPKRQKAIKKTSFGLIGKFTIKKIRILFEISFFYKTFLFFAFFNLLKDKSLFLSKFG